MYQMILSHALFTSILLYCLASSALAEDQQSSKTRSDEPSDPNAKAIQWIDEYRKVQVLFHDKDLALLRSKIASSSREDAKKWLDNSVEVRAALESAEWKSTREWLREFLKVQAIFSDEEIEQLRAEAKLAAEESPETFKAILARIEKERTTLVRGAENAEQLRKSRLRLVHAYRQDEVTSRRLVKQAAASIGAGTGQSAEKRQVIRPRPIVTSLDVARWNVMRNFWGSW